MACLLSSPIIVLNGVFTMIEKIDDFFNMENMTGVKMMFLTFGPFIVLFFAIRIRAKQLDKKFAELDLLDNP